MSYEYHRPTTLDQALELKRQPGMRVVAGGTDLFVQMRKGVTAPPALISLRNIDELAQIDAGPPVRIGAAAPLAEVARHPAVRESFPLLVESIGVLGSAQIRNVATVGGNLCNASPAANTAGPLLVYGARVELRNASAERTVPLEELFVGPGQTVLAPDEILTAILLDPPPVGTCTAFLRKGRIRMDCAIASVAVLLETDGSKCSRARVAAGACAPVPLRLRGVEDILESSDLSASVLVQAQEKAKTEIAPIDDIRSTERYRRDLVSVYVRRALEAALRSSP